MKFFQIIALIIFLTSCSDSKVQTESNEIGAAENTIEQASQEDTILNVINHQLRDSDLSYIVEISQIKFKTTKDAFELTTEKYFEPESIDGMNLTVNFKMTNPHDKPMRIPFPDYFFITAPEFKNVKGFIFSKSCKCYIDNSVRITDTNGDWPHTFAKREKGDYIVSFDKNETKEFVLYFTDIFPKFDDLKTITLGGFNKYFRKDVPMKELQKMTKAEKDIYFADKSKEFAFTISIEDELIISKGEFEK